jgi:MFS family permease
LGGTAGVLIAAGGVLGALLFAAASMALRPRLVTALVMFGGAIAYVLYATNFQEAGLALVLAVFVGMAANGGVAAFYAISPFVYPTVARGAGVGLMIGFGRGVAILSPIFTGYLLRAGWSPQDAYMLFAGILVLAGLSTVLLDLTYRGRSEDPDEVAAVPEGA